MSQNLQRRHSLTGRIKNPEVFTLVIDTCDSARSPRRKPVRWIGLLGHEDLKRSATTRDPGSKGPERVRMVVAFGQPRRSEVGRVLSVPHIQPFKDDLAPASPMRPSPPRLDASAVAAMFCTSFVVSCVALAGGALVALTGGLPTHQELSAIATKVLPSVGAVLS